MVLLRGGGPTNIQIAIPVNKATKLNTTNGRLIPVPGLRISAFAITLTRRLKFRLQLLLKYQLAEKNLPACSANSGEE